MLNRNPMCEARDASLRGLVEGEGLVASRFKGAYYENILYQGRNCHSHGNTCAGLCDLMLDLPFRKTRLASEAL